MGYESKIIIAKKAKMSNGYVWYDKLAIFDMCKMGYDFPIKKLFPNEIETESLYGFDTNITFDKYGEKLTEGKIENLLYWLLTNQNDYWRQQLLTDFLLDIEKRTIDNLVTIHYGY